MGTWVVKIHNESHWGLMFCWTTLDNVDKIFFYFLWRKECGTKTTNTLLSTHFFYFTKNKVNLL